MLRVIFLDVASTPPSRRRGSLRPKRRLKRSDHYAGPALIVTLTAGQYLANDFRDSSERVGGDVLMTWNLDHAFPQPRHVRKLADVASRMRTAPELCSFDSPGLQTCNRLDAVLHDQGIEERSNARRQ